MFKNIRFFILSEGMLDIMSEAMLKSILNGMEALITVCDPESFEIFFLNDSIRKHFGIKGDGVGHLCYKLLQELDEPCFACPYLQLREKPDKTIVWEHRERVKGSILRKTARLIDWPGEKKAHLEYAIDITDTIKVQEAITQREMTLNILNRAAIIFISQNVETFIETMTAGVGLIAGITNVDKVSVFRNIEKPDGLYVSQVYLWNKAHSSITKVDKLQEEVSYFRHIPSWRDVLASGDYINGTVRLMPEAKMLEQFGCLTVLLMPVFNQDSFWGFVSFENLTDEREFTEHEVETLRSASFMLANAVIRNEEEKKILETDMHLKRMMREVEYQNQLLYTVNKISAILLQSNAVTFENDLLQSMGIMAEAVGADRVYIWENYIHDGELYCCQTYEWSEKAEPQQDKEWVKRVSYRKVIPGWKRAFLQKRCINGIVRELPASENNILSQQGILSILAMPIFLKEQFWGFVGFDDCHSERVFSENEEKILRSASELIANSLIRNNMEENILQLEVEVDKIFHDPLTNIYNRRFFDETMQRLVRSLSRSGGMLSLLMVDIDYFKKYNDTYGHLEGDSCLKIVAKTLCNSISRADDFVVRYGGEEFVVVLPNTDETGVRMMARKLLENVRSCNIPHEKSSAANYVTVSIGAMTGKAAHTHRVDDYIQRADEMLYDAKQGGRNRYSFASL
ncbi:MAG: diguanylate cyclase [Eubacterium sp.]|nr:diguanylate cyclase [Eubacterium sp.]